MCLYQNFNPVYMYIHDCCLCMVYIQLAQQMDESHQKQVGELNEELIEVKARI